MSEANNFQRLGSISNAHAGSSFEQIARDFFAKEGLQLVPNFTAPVGAAALKKARKFDLGSDHPPVLVECKSHKWTSGGNVPSAKITVWNKSMYYFHIAPPNFRKILFVLKHDRRQESLATCYLRCYGHLVPEAVEVWEILRTRRRRRPPSIRHQPARSRTPRLVPQGLRRAGGLAASRGPQVPQPIPRLRRL